MSDKKHGLGRGLSALLGDNQRTAAQPAESGVRVVEIARIRPNPGQPRKHFDSESLDELAQSIAQHGLLQPILVRQNGDDYTIIAGERRWRAAQRAQLHEIPVVVRDDGDEAMAEIALIENVQRQDLNAIEEAEGYAALIASYEHTQDSVAKIVGKSRSHVTNLLRLLDLPNGVRQMLLRGDISMGHARAIAAAPEPEVLAKEIAANGLSVRQAEQLARTAKPATVSSRSTTSPAPINADIAALERQLGDMLGLRVKVGHSGKGGTVSLHYSTLDQLDMICQRLSGEKI